jgi:hypothetical protein
MLIYTHLSIIFGKHKIVPQLDHFIYLSYKSEINGRISLKKSLTQGVNADHNLFKIRVGNTSNIGSFADILAVLQTHTAL